MNSLLGGMMSNLDGFVDKMDAKVAGIFGEGMNPGRAVFNQQAANNGYDLSTQQPDTIFIDPPAQSALDPVAPAVMPPQQALRPRLLRLQSLPILSG